MNAPSSSTSPLFRAARLSALVGALTTAALLVPAATVEALRVDAAAVADASRFAEVAAVLAEQGHLPTTEGHVEVAEPDAVRDAATRFLRFHGLLETGDPVRDVADFIALDLPRCSRPDIEPATTAQAKYCQFEHTDITIWDGIGPLKGLTPEQKHAGFVAAIESWERTGGITGILVKEKAGADIASESGPIDRPGGILAWSNLPCSGDRSGQMAQKYDTHETWTPPLWQETSCHELGHALGLPHAGPDSVMAPYATGRKVVPQPADRIPFQARYGPPKPANLPAPAPAPTPPAPSPTPGPTPHIVTGEISFDGTPYVLVPKGAVAPPSAGPAPTPDPAPVTPPAPVEPPARPGILKRLGEVLTSDAALAIIGSLIAGALGLKGYQKIRAPKPAARSRR